jgi:uncharacterized membrane protein
MLIFMLFMIQNLKILKTNTRVFTRVNKKQQTKTQKHIKKIKLWF